MADANENKVTEVTETAEAVAETAAETVAEVVEAAPVEEKKEAAKKEVKKSTKHVDAIKLMTEGMIREDQHKVNIGDTVRVHVRIKEGERSRIQVFEGTVIAKKHGGIHETFTVRRTSYGVGVERVFPINSPNVEKVEIVRSGKVRRAKLYYLRDRVGKAAKVKQKLNR